MSDNNKNKDGLFPDYDEDRYSDPAQYYDDGEYGEEDPYYEDNQLDTVYNDESGLEYNEPCYHPLESAPGKNEVIITGGELDEDEFESGDVERRDYYPIRFRRDRKFGCLGGFMYAVFVISVSLILACLGWMAASDVLALNKDSVTATIEIPKDIFTMKEVDIKDEDGNVIGTEEKASADIDYVATLLKDNGLIEYKFLFELYAKISNADLKINPGTYELSTDFDYRALVTKMKVGSESQVQTTVMFPEGYTMRQIFRKLEENNICSYEDLMDAAANNEYDYENIPLSDATLGDATRLEGYLFPDTYQFYEGMPAKNAIRTLLATFHNKVTAEMYEQADKLGITFYEGIIIASLIEKEASAAEGEREKIASVIYNRLAAGEVLGIDATSLYMHPDHEGAPTNDMLYDESDPYNTRIKGGLPPTPICNPGAASLIAAFKPENTQYYFYALNAETGNHEFFTNRSDFDAFVATQNY